MKIDLSRIVVNEKGRVQIEIDCIEDFWTLANVIRPGDKVRSQIRRKVKSYDAGTGKSNPQTVLLKAAIRVCEIVYQPGVDEMHLRGTLVHDIEGGKAGTFQRVLLSIGRPFMLTKPQWDQFTLEQIEEAANPVSNATVAAVLLQTGVANVCIVGRNCTRIVDHLEKATPKLKKVGGSEKVTAAKRALFDRTALSLSEKVDLAAMKVVIVASPGFLAREFLQFLRENAPKFAGVQPAFQADKFLEASVPNAYLDSLEDLLMQPAMAAHVQDMKAVRQAKMLGEFEQQMSHDFQMVSLGEQNVIEDLTNRLVKVLLVTDEYLLELEFERRRQLMQLRDRLVDGGDEALVFSVKHPSGQRLKDLTAGVGIAALLKTRVPREYQQEGFDDDGGMPD